MTEKQLKLLGFKREDSVDDIDSKPAFYYYVYNIAKGLSLISCCNDELVNHEWYVEFMDTEPKIIYNEFGKLQALINELEKAKI